VSEENKTNNPQELTLTQLRSMIKNAGYDWVAGETPISRLSDEEQKIRLGLEVPEDEMERIKSVLAKEIKAFAFAPKRDWRDKDGKNWVTTVQDQGGCGSCVAFGTVATIESQARIQYNKPAWDIDLSEADLFFCGAGRKCKKGWWPSYALDYAKSKGISDEKCFPYQDEDIDCTLCSDRADRLLKIGKWHEIINIDQRKQWLDTKGPMVACMAVYSDFFKYKDGVYRHTTGDLAGYHAICCIGYSEEEKCWICKNSWGTGWGNQGFFKIGYGEAEMDTKFAMYGVEEITGTLTPNGEEEDYDWAEHVVIDHNFEANQRVLWAYVKGKWRYQFVSDVQLAGIGNALFEANSVQVWFKGNKISCIRGWKKFS